MSWKRVVLSQFGGPENLKIETLEALPEPNPDEVRVKVLAAGTGFTDTIIRRGQYTDVKEKPPFTPGYDWFGVIDAVGSEVRNLEVGQQVADMSVIGGYSQYLTVKADRVVPAPPDIDPAKGVCMILSYTTAYQLLKRVRNIPPGATCLVHAAGGAVGTALLDLGRLMGLTMYGTASQPKHDAVREYGGIPIDYKNEDFVERILRETKGRGVDVVFDTIGGRNFARSYRCVARGGELIGYGFLQYTTGEENIPSILWAILKMNLLWKFLPDGRKSSFYNIHRRRAKYPQQFKDDVGTLFDWLKDGKLNPLIADIRPLEDVIAVHRQIDNAEITGKVILKCN